MQVTDLLRVVALAPPADGTHVGLFLTLTLPSRFHPVKMGRGGRFVPNSKHDGSTPRDGQLWLRGMWAKVRAALARQGVRMYGLRLVEPHSDATPHWHVLIWADDEAGAQAIEVAVRKFWLSDDGHEPGAHVHRVNLLRMAQGDAAGCVEKYIAQRLGPQNPGDVQEAGEAHCRVEAWASAWGIRQVQTFGMPPGTAPVPLAAGLAGRA